MIFHLFNAAFFCSVLHVLHNVQLYFTALTVVGSIINWRAHEVFVLMALSSNEGSDEFVHMRRLTRAFAARIHKNLTKFLNASPDGYANMGIY